jgi:hypothetical protein
MRPRRTFTNSHAIAAVMLALHAGLLLNSIRTNYITLDEIGHVIAGLSYVKTARFQIYRVNPPLPQLLAVLPVLTMQPKMDFDNLSDDPHVRLEYKLVQPFIADNSLRIFDLVRRARLAGVVWSLLGGWIIYLWALELYGMAGGWVALLLWCVEPYVLGNAGVVTSDVPAGVAGVAASYAFWRYLRLPTPGRDASRRRAILAGVQLGLAGLTKFTLLLLFPLWPVLWAVDRWILGCRDPIKRRLGLEAEQLSLIVLLGVLVINSGYFFRGTFRPLDSYPFISKSLAGKDLGDGLTKVVGNRFRGTPLGLIRVPLPEDLVRGIDVQRFDFESRPRSYLGGEWRRRGWWYYYVYALVVKLPLGTIGLVAWGIGLVLITRGDRSRIRDEVVLLATASALFAFVSSQTGQSQHSRYAIPALPYLFIIAGKTGRFFVGPGHRAARILALALLTWSATSSLLIYPHSLSYFNELAGGPARGHDHLLDSNIDWGQDLLYLKSWLDQHPEVGPLKLAYFGSVEPSLNGLKYELPPPGPEAADLAQGRPIGPLPGDYAISVNFLRGFELFTYNGRGGTHQVGPHEFEYFRDFRPIARAGYSISIYRITAEQAEAERRRRGMPRPGTPGG